MHFINQQNFISIKDFVTFILTVSGLIIAGMGLSTWRKQIKGVKEFETSYNLHYSLLRLRNAIKHVRNPAIWGAENYKAIQYFKNKYPDRIDDKGLEKNSDVYVYEMRWEEITEAYTEMESHLLAAEVLWGSEVLDKIMPLKKKVVELNISLKQYLDPRFRTDTHKNLSDIIYDQGDEKDQDAFSKEIAKAIEGIADYIKQKMK